MVPSVARAQLKPVDHSGRPKLLNAEFATNSAPMKKKLAESQLQNACIICAPCPSSEKNRVKGSCSTAITSHATPTANTMNIRLARKLSRTRSNRLAPRFCAKTGPTAPLRECINPKATGVSRSIVACPATADAPKAAMVCVTKAAPTGWPDR